MPSRSTPRRPVSLKARALQWLAQREHSRAELRVRLLRAAAGVAVAGPHVASAEADLATEAWDAAQDTDEVAASELEVDHAAEVDAVLDWLSASGYLSDQRFVDSRIHSRQARFGNLRIERELAQHGLAPDAQARQQLRESELARAREVWRRKYEVPASDPAERARQMRFLAGRGFSPDVIRRVVRGGSDDD